MAILNKASLWPAQTADFVLARGQRVALRELRWDDLDEMASWPPFAEPDLQWVNLDLKSPAQRRIWYHHELYDATRKRLAIVLEGRLIGVLGLRSIDHSRRRATLGIRLSAVNVNRGYGTDAIKALFLHAFGRLGLQHLDLDVAENNYRAQRCYQKCGFRLTDKHRDIRGGLYFDMSISAAEAGKQGGRTLPA